MPVIANAVGVISNALCQGRCKKRVIATEGKQSIICYISDQPFIASNYYLFIMMKIYPFAMMRLLPFGRNDALFLQWS